jgi:hypothetical protein
MTSQPSYRAIAAVTCLYRGLLLAYPRSFRRTFGGEMVDAFAERCRHAARGGWWRLLLVAAAGLLDLVATASAERLDSIMHPRPLFLSVSRVPRSTCATPRAACGSVPRSPRLSY